MLIILVCSFAGWIPGLLQEATAAGACDAQWHPPRRRNAEVRFGFPFPQQPWNEESQDEGVKVQKSWRDNQIICSETNPEYEYGVALLAIGPIRSHATSIGRPVPDKYIYLELYFLLPGSFGYGDIGCWCTIHWVVQGFVAMWFVYCSFGAVNWWMELWKALTVLVFICLSKTDLRMLFGIDVTL